MKSHPFSLMRASGFALPALVLLFCLTGCSREARLVDPEQILKLARREILSFRVKEAKQILEAGGAAFPEKANRGETTFISWP